IFLLAEPEEEHLACQLAFWLNKPITLVEMIETSHSSSIIANACFALLAIGKWEWVEENLHYLENKQESSLVQTALLYFQKGIKQAFQALCRQLFSSPTNAQMRCAYFLFDRALLDGKTQISLPCFNAFPSTPFLDALRVQTNLMQGQWKEAFKLLETYS